VYRANLALRSAANARALRALAKKYPDEYFEEYRKEIEKLGMKVGKPKLHKGISFS
jgi:hypothetical protein